jgi:hypothetical protein
LDAQHGEGVELTLQLPEANAAALVVRINDAGQGKVVWLEADADAETPTN